MKPAGRLSRIAAAGVLAVIAAAPTQYALEVLPKTYLSLVDPLLWVVCAVWAADVLRRRAWRTLVLPPLPLLVFLAAAALSLIRAEDRMAGLKDLFQLAEYFAAAYALFATHAAAGPAGAARMRDVFLASATLVTALGAAHYLTPAVSDFRVRATFGNANVFGGFLALAAPLAWSAACAPGPWWRRAWGAAVGLAALPLALGGGALAALAAGYTLVAALRGRAAWAVTATVLAGFVLLAPRLPRDTVEAARRSTALYNDDVEVAMRYTEWQAAGIMFLESPLLGVGAGNYQANIGRYYGTLPDPAGRTVEPDTQNLYLVVAASLGVAALLGWLGALAQAAGAALRRGLAGGGGAADAGLYTGLAGSLLAFAVGAVWSPLLVRGIGVPLALVLALASATPRKPEPAAAPPA